MKKMLAILIVFAMSSSMLVSVAGIDYESLDNLIVNGTFDENMNSWDILKSENFTIQSVAGECQIKTNHTDWLIDNSTIDFQTNLTLVNLNIQTGDYFQNTAEDKLSPDWIEAVNSTENIFNLTDINDWEYVEPEYPENYFIRDAGDFTIESRQNNNWFYTTEEYYDLGDEPSQANFQGGGENYYKWNDNNAIECEFINNWTGFEHSSRRYWDIPDIDDNMFEVGDWFGYEVDFELNQTVTSLSQVLFGIMNKTHDSTAISPGGDTNGIIVELIGAPSNEWAVNYYISDDNQGTASVFNTTEILDGVSIFITGEVTSITPFTIITYVDIYANGWELKDSIILPATQMDYTLDCVAISNQDLEMYLYGPNTVNQSFYGNITSIGYWAEHSDMDTSVSAYYSRNYTLTKNASLETSIEYKHYLDAQNGFVQSMAIIYDDRVYENLRSDTLYSLFTTSTMTEWADQEWDLDLEMGELELRLYTSQSTQEGNNNFPAKSASWRNLWVNKTTYSTDGYIESNIKTNDYYGHWLQMELKLDRYFWYLDSYPHMGSFIIQTRTGNTSTPDGTWSDWENTVNTEIIRVPIDVLITVTSDIVSPPGNYSQYRIYTENAQTDDSFRIMDIGISSVQIYTDKTSEWATIKQTFNKPYTSYSYLRYKYNIDYLNNTDVGNITIMIDDYVVHTIDFTYYTSPGWITDVFDLPIAFNVTSDFTLNITLQARFNSTDGTATVLFDDVGILIDKQAPTITSLNIQNGTKVIIDGTFTDLTRGSDYDYLGLEGIKSVFIEVDNTTLEVTNITYIGNGNFTFNYIWEDTPSELTHDTFININMVVIDTTNLQDSILSEVTARSILMYYIMFFASLMLIMFVLILVRHMARDTEGDIFPEVLTGKKDGI